MQIFIEMICSLVTFFVITGNKKFFSGAYLAIVLAALFLAGVVLGNIWALLVFLPILAGFGVLIGVLLGVSVNWLSSPIKGPTTKRAIWLCGLALLMLMSFHSKYRSAYESVTACDDQVQNPQTALAIFEGLKDAPFEIVLDPAFAWIGGWREVGGSFLWGESTYGQNLGNSKLRSEACNLTGNFSRPIRLRDYKLAIRVDSETGEWLGSEVEQEYDSYNYIPLRFQARFREGSADQEIVTQNGQPFRIMHRFRSKNRWRFSTDYHGLTMTFDLEGEGDKPPIEQATLIFENFRGLKYLVPAKSW